MHERGTRLPGPTFVPCVGCGRGGQIEVAEGHPAGSRPKRHSMRERARRACNAQRFFVDAGRACLQSRDSQAFGPGVAGNLRAGYFPGASPASRRPARTPGRPRTRSNFEPAPRTFVPLCLTTRSLRGVRPGGRPRHGAGARSIFPNHREPTLLPKKSRAAASEETGWSRAPGRTCSWARGRTRTTRRRRAAAACS